MTVYIYNASDGRLKHSLSGAYEAIILNISEGEDFTLTAPPNNHDKWHWIDDRWTAYDTAN
ncbi:hypothetical protein ACS8E2_10010 [Psychrobacter glaciei]|uniref:hypothetical protein n=1 Tax=Psychrobacter glaciei TaxID=619771 RepID=UPI003F46470A